MFEIGEKIKVRLDCTIEELSENKWNKAHKDTLEFLKICDLEKTYRINRISPKGNIVFEDLTDRPLYVNPELFEYSDGDDEEPVEMTLEQIEEELGYKVKIVE